MRFRDISFCFLSLFVPFYNISSQELFSRYDTTVDYRHYKTADDCVVAVARVLDSLKGSSKDWEDTTELSLSVRSMRIPQSPEGTARLCLERFHADSLPAVDLIDWGALYLVANMDSQARVALERMVEFLRDSISEVGALQRARMVYMSSMPVRYSEVKRLNKRIDTLLDGLSWDKRFREIELRIGQVFLPMNDTLEAYNASELLIDVWEAIGRDSVSDHRRSHHEKTVYGAKNLLNVSEIMDSMRVSDESYFQVLQRNWEDVSESDFLSGIHPVGKDAPPVEAEYWFRSKNDSFVEVNNVLLPAAGNVTLMVFLNSYCHDRSLRKDQRWNIIAKHLHCWQSYAILRRFREQFPDLEIAIISKTRGVIGNAPQLTVREEADTLADYFLNFHGIDGVIGVVETPYIRLQDPDLRRVNTSSSVDDAYAGFFPNNTGTEHMRSYIIGRSGKILHVGTLRRVNEHGFRSILDALIQDK